jgi:hypothetical protein
MGAKGLAWLIAGYITSSLSRSAARDTRPRRFPRRLRLDHIFLHAGLSPSSFVAYDAILKESPRALRIGKRASVTLYLRDLHTHTMASRKKVLLKVPHM